MPDARPVVAVTRRLPSEVEQVLAGNFAVRLNEDDHPWSTEELEHGLRTADGLLCTVTDQITAERMAVQPLRTRILANFGVGFNHIDIEAAAALGIAVTNTPGVLTDATAELTIALMLMVARRAGQGERIVRAGKWDGWGPTDLLGRTTIGRTLGIIGMGRIGRAVARMASGGLGMSVIYFNPSPVPAAEAIGAEPRDSVEAVLAESDFVSLHCPSTPATHHLIDAERLAAMQPGAYLINTARGDVVDESALINALENGNLGGVALDVYEAEPEVPQRLRQLENVVLLPHMGSATVETRVAMGLKAAANLAAFFRGEPLPDPVVAPAASAPLRPGADRTRR